MYANKKPIKAIHLTNGDAIKFIQQRAKCEQRSLSNALMVTVIEHLGQNNPKEVTENPDKCQ